MKVHCPDHGAHFNDEIDDFVACPNYWKATGLTQLPPQAKYDIAEWLMKMPVDKIWLETGWGISVPLFKGAYVGNDQSIAAMIPGYEEMTNEERKALQRAQFKQEYERKPSWISRLLRKK